MLCAECGIEFLFIRPNKGGLNRKYCSRKCNQRLNNRLLYIRRGQDLDRKMTNKKAVLTYQEKCKRVEPTAYKTRVYRIAKNYQLKAAYNMELADFNALIELQAGLCNLCTKPMKPGKGTHIDHNHDTDKVRGLLCSNCNTGIGLLEEDPVLFSAASEYVV